MDRGTCWATVHRVAKSQTRLSKWACRSHPSSILQQFPGPSLVYFGCILEECSQINKLSLIHLCISPFAAIMVIISPCNARVFPCRNLTDPAAGGGLVQTQPRSSPSCSYCDIYSWSRWACFQAHGMESDILFDQKRRLDASHLLGIYNSTCPLSFPRSVWTLSLSHKNTVWKNLDVPLNSIWSTLLMASY